MATILTLVSGLTGFLAALTGFFLFDMSALSALALWSLSGVGATLLGLAIAMLPRAPQAQDRFHELA